MITLEDVSFIYPSGNQALTSFSFTVKEGEFVALMGASGAGKTTLIKHLNGLLKPSKGKILVDNIDTKKATVAQLSRKVGIVFQNPDRQFFCETVEDEILFGLRNFGFNDNAVEERLAYTLNLLGLEKLKDKSPFQLSEGEKKRVVLACALAWEPKYLVLDEPFLGQDYKQKEKLRYILTDLKRKGVAVIMATHEVELVWECACRVVIMSKGCLIADGKAEETLTSLKLIEAGKLVSPQLVEVFSALPHVDFKKHVFTVEDAYRFLADKFER